jgi:hypothetical protein
MFVPLTLIAWLCAIEGNGCIAVLKMRVVRVRREKKNIENLALIRRWVMANRLQRARLLGRSRARSGQPVSRRKRAIGLRCREREGDDRNDNQSAG